MKKNGWKDLQKKKKRKQIIKTLIQLLNLKSVKKQKKCFLKRVKKEMRLMNSQKIQRRDQKKKKIWQIEKMMLKNSKHRINHKKFYLINQKKILKKYIEKYLNCNHLMMNNNQKIKQKMKLNNKLKKKKKLIMKNYKVLI